MRVFLYTGCCSGCPELLPHKMGVLSELLRSPHRNFFVKSITDRGWAQSVMAASLWACRSFSRPASLTAQTDFLLAALAIALALTLANASINYSRCLVTQITLLSLFTSISVLAVIRFFLRIQR